jgi:16S rRNA (cytidine1402-2'-O)-methyltransferase
VRGEIAVVLAGAGPSVAPLDALVARVRERVDGGERMKDAVSAVAAGSGVPKRELYAAAVSEEPAESAEDGAPSDD